MSILQKWPASKRFRRIFCGGVLRRVPCTDKLITGGNFNVRVGMVDKWPGVIGLCRAIKCKTETVNFFWIFARNTIWWSQTLPSRARIITRPHRCSPTLNTGTVYVTVRQVDQNDILARPMRGAEGLTGHVLLRSIVAFSINKKRAKLPPNHPARLIWWNYEIKISNISWRRKCTRFWQDCNINSRKLLKKTGIL